MSDRTTDNERLSAQAEQTGNGVPTSIAEAESDTSSPPERVVKRGGTFESFRHRGYLYFWSGALVSNAGSWMQNAVIALVAYNLRKSEVDLGLVSFAAQIPNLFLALPGGVLADRVDKRRLIIWAQVLLMVQAVVFGIAYVTGHLGPGTPGTSLLIMCALGVVAGVLTALSFPAWQAIIPDLVPRKDLLNAIALNSAQFQSGRMVGGAATAAVIAAAGYAAGVADVFWLNAISFLFVIAAVWAAKTSPHMRTPNPEHAPERVWPALVTGLRYVAKHRLVAVVISSAAVMTLFGMPYVVLLPAVADKVLGFHAQAEYTRIYTLLFVVNGFGALVGALAVASLPHTVRRETLIPWSMLATAVVLIAFAFTPWLWLSVVLSALAGACVLTANSLNNTSVQANTPHHLRGRVMSVYITFFLGMMPLSAAAFGPLAQWIGTSWAIAGGAAVLLVWTAILFLKPGLLAPQAVPED